MQLKTTSTHPFGDPVAVDRLSRRQSGEALRSWWVDAEAFVDDGLKVRELLRGGRVDFGVGGIAAADFLAEFVVCGGGGFLEQVVRCGCEEGGYGLATGDAVALDQCPAIFSDGLPLLRTPELKREPPSPPLEFPHRAPCRQGW